MNMREEVYLQELIASMRGFDWLPVFALFFVGLFYLLPQLMGYTLNARARGCFIGATWILVFKLFIHLVRILLLSLDMFNTMVGPRPGGGPGGTLTAVVAMFFPIIEGMFFVLAVVLFVAGLPNMVQPKDARWEPPPPRSDEPR